MGNSSLVPTVLRGNAAFATLRVATADAKRREERVPTRSVGTRMTLGLIAVFLAGSAPDRAWGLPADPPTTTPAAPATAAEGGVDEHLDAPLPPDLPFVDSQDGPTTLGRFFDGSRPVILSMNYSNCPKLCSLQLNGLVRGLEGLDWDLGQKFQVVTVSIDPQEKPERAQVTKEKYLKIYGRANAGAGWHFLTGAEKDIERLAQTVGFHYRYVPETQQYAHDVVLMILTPSGHVSRYLYGFDYDAKTVRFALLEASQGKIGSTTDRILLFCYHYDAQAGRYGPAAVKIMRLGGILTVLILGGVLLMFWRYEVSGKGKGDRHLFPFRKKVPVPFSEVRKTPSRGKQLTDP